MGGILPNHLVQVLLRALTVSLDELHPTQFIKGVGHLGISRILVKQQLEVLPCQFGIRRVHYQVQLAQPVMGIGRIPAKWEIGEKRGESRDSIIIYIVVNLGDNWWIYAFGAVFTLQAVIFFLYPVLIMPLFNKFEPLDNEEFKKPIEKLLKKVDFKSKGLFVMNASLRSTHGNAFFTGFGKNKRIVFFDTLLKTITPDEMEAILGHELGHYKLGHIRKTLISSLVFGFIGFYILSEVLKSDNFFLDHGLESLTIYSKFLLFYLVAGSYTFFTRPFTSALSRKREFEADDFSFQYTNGEYMISGLLKLSKDNASNLTPDSLYSSYYYSHPPIAERVASIENKLK